MSNRSIAALIQMTSSASVGRVERALAERAIGFYQTVVEKHVTKDGDIIDVEYERIAPMPSGVAGAASAGAPRCAAPVPSVATAPKARRFVVLVNPAAISATEVTSKAVDAAARTLGVEITFVSASTPDGINTAFAGIARERPEALFIAGDPFFAGRAVQLANLAMRERLPASFTTRPMVQAGLLMSYGVDIIDSFRQVGAYAGNILKGAKPTDLPVQQSTKLQLVFNLQTAKALGLEIPPMLLARADEVIE